MWTTMKAEGSSPNADAQHVKTNCLLSQDVDMLELSISEVCHGRSMRTALEQLLPVLVFAGTLSSKLMREGQLTASPRSISGPSVPPWSHNVWTKNTIHPWSHRQTGSWCRITNGLRRVKWSSRTHSLIPQTWGWGRTHLYLHASFVLGGGDVATWSAQHGHGRTGPTGR